jgi:hypothetical protein
MREELDRLSTSRRGTAARDGATLRAARRLNRASGVWRPRCCWTARWSTTAAVLPTRRCTSRCSSQALHWRSVRTESPINGLRRTGCGRWCIARGNHRPAGNGVPRLQPAETSGSWSWQNLFYGAPLGAPMAILLAGLLGTAAEAARDNPPHRARVLGFPAGRLLSVVSGLGMLVPRVVHNAE